MSLFLHEMEGVIAGPPIILDAMRMAYADAIVPGALWYFSREPYPARYPDSAFRLRSYVPPMPKAKK